MIKDSFFSVTFSIYCHLLWFPLTRCVSGAVLHHAGGGRHPAVLHGAGSGAVPSEGRHHLLGATRAALQRLV